VIDRVGGGLWDRRCRLGRLFYGTGEGIRGLRSQDMGLHMHLR
jgi:hypothetical protein